MEPVNQTRVFVNVVSVILVLSVKLKTLVVMWLVAPTALAKMENAPVTPAFPVIVVKLRTNVV